MGAYQVSFLRLKREYGTNENVRNERKESGRRASLRSFRIFPFVPYSLVLLAFIGCGIEGLRHLNLHNYLRDEPAAFIKSLDRDATVDGYLRELLYVEGVSPESLRRPAQTLRIALSTLPEGAVVVVVPRDEPKYNVVFMTVKYLSLPQHRVYYLPCDRPDRAGLPADEKIAALLLYLIEPPPGMSGYWRVLPRMTLRTTSEAEAWKAYCSQ
jgi:hypothetical protein